MGIFRAGFVGVWPEVQASGETLDARVIKRTATAHGVAQAVVEHTNTGPGDVELGGVDAAGILGYLAKVEEGLSTRQLLARLSRREPDPDKREALLQTLLIKLAEEGYLSQPDAQGRIRYLSFLLRDWWRRNHA